MSAPIAVIFMLASGPSPPAFGESELARALSSALKEIELTIAPKSGAACDGPERLRCFLRALDRERLLLIVTWFGDEGGKTRLSITALEQRNATESELLAGAISSGFVALQPSELDAHVRGLIAGPFRELLEKHRPPPIDPVSKPAEPSWTQPATRWSGIGLAAIGATLVLYALAAPPAQRTIGATSDPWFASFCELGAPSDCTPGSGLRVAPLGGGLIAAGAWWSIGSSFEDGEHVPWISILGGIASGALIYGLSVALEPAVGR